ncbi:MAG: tRNA 5-methoxyuridine(34)/uridine 5-oxyacetic acid(34) synthase CmoB [Methylococcales bacterium]|nr:tRNA 5-methoxyuridine(34)/uridine 5-oxyacetic acid(34) synthase CmoB [Methylococcaceae bacterium]
MINYQPLHQTLLDAKADAWVELLPQQIKNALSQNRHGTLSQWQDMIAELPVFETSYRLLDQDTVQIGNAADLPMPSRERFESQLKTLLPWRKGPYELFGIKIDTEWRSDWKWNRLKDHISSLNDRLVLDVGCGNGYHCWRMLGAGARMVIGVDPLVLNVMQFQLIRKLHGEAPIYVLPIGIEDIPSGLKCFDTVFSMGVLYHRRSPIDHLLELKACLKPGGELVLETLIIDGGPGETLLPEDRYARMRNVWFLPTCATLTQWLTRCGFGNIRIVDVTTTSTEEQRTTEWMPFHSLENFIDPENPALTCEGLPAPKRAIVIANAV